jgi:hypothetical protein
MIQKKAGLAARQVVGIQGGEGVLGERLLWVTSGRSPQYCRNVRFRGQSGRSDTIFQAVDRECPVSPEAVIQIRRLGRF